MNFRKLLYVIDEGIRMMVYVTGVHGDDECQVR